MKSRFEEFIEIDKFRKALGYVSRATGLAFAMLDPLGNIIIPPMNESEFCVEARKDRNVASRCVDCIIHSAIAAAKCAPISTTLWTMSIRNKTSIPLCKSIMTSLDWWKRTGILPQPNSSR